MFWRDLDYIKLFCGIIFYNIIVSKYSVDGIKHGKYIFIIVSFIQCINKVLIIWCIFLFFFFNELDMGKSFFLITFRSKIWRSKIWWQIYYSKNLNPLLHGMRYTNGNKCKKIGKKILLVIVLKFVYAYYDILRHGSSLEHYVVVIVAFL